MSNCHITSTDSFLGCYFSRSSVRYEEIIWRTLMLQLGKSVVIQIGGILIFWQVPFNVQRQLHLLAEVSGGIPMRIVPKFARCRFQSSSASLLQQRAQFSQERQSCFNGGSLHIGWIFYFKKTSIYCIKPFFQNNDACHYSPNTPCMRIQVMQPLEVEHI